MDDINSQLIELGSRLAESAVKNTASTVATKIRSIKAKKNDKEAINELEQIIQELVADKNELTQIAQSYEQELLTQKMSDSELNYVTNSLIPKLKQLLEKIPQTEESHQKQNLDEIISVLTPIVSIETLTILQLLGFNFRKAIGEPLTVLLQQTILSKTPITTLKHLEYGELEMQRQIELLKLAQDSDAVDRYLKLTGHA